MFPKDLLELLEDAGLPKDVAHYCVMPFVYPNTNKQRKQIIKHRKALMTQMRFVSNPYELKLQLTARLNDQNEVMPLGDEVDLTKKDRFLTTVVSKYTKLMSLIVNHAQRDYGRYLLDLYWGNGRHIKYILSNSKFLKRIGAENPYL